MCDSSTCCNSGTSTSYSSCDSRRDSNGAPERRAGRRSMSMQRPRASLGAMALIAALLVAQSISSVAAQVPTGHNYTQALELPFMCVPALSFIAREPPGGEPGPPSFPLAHVPSFSPSHRFACRFLEIQQSGYLPFWNRFTRDQPDGWRGNSHTLDGQGPSAYGVDLSGGWYDAGGEEHVCDMHAVGQSASGWAKAGWGGKLCCPTCPS